MTLPSRLTRFVAALAWTTSACTLVSGLGDLEVLPLATRQPSDAGRDNDAKGSSDTPDGSTPPSAADAGDGSAPGDASLAPAVNDSFESNTDCDGWEAEFATATPAAPGFSGLRSCRVCQVGSDVGSLHKYLPIPAGAWTLTARVHGGSNVGTTTIAFGGFDTATESVLGESETPLVNDWRLLQAAFTTAGPTALEIFFEGFASQACYLVDEVRLEKAPSP